MKSTFIDVWMSYRRCFTRIGTTKHELGSQDTLHRSWNR